MPIAYLLDYLLTGLDTAPDTHAVLLKGATDWEAKPGPDRFTVRESIAHLADWEPIWLERMQRIVGEDYPSLPSIDEEQIAIDHDYARSDPQESLRRYRSGRNDLVAFLRGVGPDDWHRKGVREGAGEMSLFEMAAGILGHDGYHVRHTIESAGVVV